MYRFYIRPEQVSCGEVVISGMDVNHIRNVLRMKPGEKIIACDGQGMDYICEIMILDKEKIIAREMSHALTNTELSTRITLFQGIPKKDKMELIVQKAVELGVSEIVPVMMKRCVAKLEEPKKEQKRRERWQGIAEAAAKQSGRGMIPIIKPIVSYYEALQQAKAMNLVIIPYENAQKRVEKEIFQKAAGLGLVGVFIGPEGGFESQEIENAKEIGAKIISLGKRILRTETAGLTTLSILMYEMEGK